MQGLIIINIKNTETTMRLKEMLAERDRIETERRRQEIAEEIVIDTEELSIEDGGYSDLPHIPYPFLPVNGFQALFEGIEDF